MSAREAAAVGVDVAQALAAVHAAGLLHCDVKAQNVVRESGGRVVLMDLGAGRLAPEARDGDQLSDVAGTPRYMAPELFAAGRQRHAAPATSTASACCCISWCRAGSRSTARRSANCKQAHASGQTHAAWRGPCRICRQRCVDAGVEGHSIAIPTLRPESAAEMQSALAADRQPSLRRRRHRVRSDGGRLLRPVRSL